MKMSANTNGGEGLTPQLQAELVEFEEVLKEYKINLNPSPYITSEEYEDSMEVLEEFLKHQEGFGLEHKNSSPMEEDAVINFDNRVPTPGYSTAEMRDLYLADVDIEMEDFMELNLELDCNPDLNQLELDDLLFAGVDESSSPNEKPVLVAEKPHASEDVQIQPEYIDGQEYQYGCPPVLTVQVTPEDLKDKEEISVNIMYNHIPTEDIPTDPHDIPTDTDDIPTDTDDIPTDTDDISTEPEDNSSDNEDITANPKHISTDPFATLVDPNTFWEPLPYTINTWMMNREKDRKEKLERKAKTTVNIHPSTTTRASGTTSYPRRRLFFENQKESSLSIPETRSRSQIRTNAKENASLCEAADKEKSKEANLTCLVKEKQTSGNGNRKRKCSWELRRTFRST